MAKKQYGFLSPFMKRKMSDKDRLNLSNKAHVRLKQIAREKGDGVKFYYHQEVISQQKIQDKIISKDDRKRIYQDNDFYVRHSRSAFGHDTYYG